MRQGMISRRKCRVRPISPRSASGSDISSGRFLTASCRLASRRSTEPCRAAASPGARCTRFSALAATKRMAPAAPIPLRPLGGRGRGPSRQRREGEVGTGAGPVLWCVKRPELYGPGLMAHGLDPARLIVVTVPRDEDILWAVEEGLRAPGLAAVVGEIARLPLVAGRRLQLAAEHSGITAFLLRRWRNGMEAAAERERPSAAVTRWRIAAIPAREVVDPRLRHSI